VTDRVHAEEHKRETAAREHAQTEKNIHLARERADQERIQAEDRERAENERRDLKRSRADERTRTDQKRAKLLRRQAEKRANAERKQGERDHAQAADLQRRVDALLKIVNAAANGDLTSTVSSEKQDAIGQMSDALTHLLANLCTNIGKI